MDEQRLHLLLHRYLDQALTDSENAELQQELLSSSKARTEFWKLARFDASLRHWGETEWGMREGEKFAESTLRKNSRRRVITWAGGLAAAAAVALVFLNRLPNTPGLALESQPSDLPTFLSTAHAAAADPLPEVRGAAVLRRALGASWLGLKTAPQVGEALPAGIHRIAQGIVQLELSRGARVVFEGPGEFELVSDHEVFLRSGKARVFVPEPARDFRLLTATATIADLGTEFGCLARSDGVTEVHVLSGSVEIRPSGRADRSILYASSALSVSPSALTPISFRPSDFILDEELARRELAWNSHQVESWREARKELSARPSTLLHLDFEGAKGWSRTLPNLAEAAKNATASIVGCDSTEGRWPGKAALEFKRPDDTIRTNLPGEFKDLTFCAWVRVDSAPSRQHSLIMADGFKKGIVHWFLNRGGNLVLGLHVGQDGDTSGWRFIRSAPVLRSGTLGSWVFLTTVAKGGAGTIEHYLNGHLVPNTDNLHSMRGPYTIGACDIGNWGVRLDDPRWAGIQLNGPYDHIRSFQGRMDEFAVFNEALDPDTILSIYESGRPGDTTVTALPAVPDPKGTVVR